MSLRRTPSVIARSPLSGRRGNLLLACALLLTVVLLTAGCTSHPNTPTAPRGIILVSADTLGAGHIGLYGYGPDTSPTIDRWAENAIVFRNAFAQLPGTLPSHMSMMTGLTPRQHGVYPSKDMPMALSTDIPTLAEYLNQGGYRTAGFTEGGYVAGVFGFNRGFDQFQDRFSTEALTSFRTGSNAGRTFWPLPGNSLIPWNRTNPSFSFSTPTTFTTPTTHPRITAHGSLPCPNRSPSNPKARTW